MKTTGKCPKCGSGEIYTNDKKLLLSEHSYVGTTLFGRLPLVTFICSSCGYLEDYAKDLAGGQMNKVKENWRKAGSS